MKDRTELMPVQSRDVPAVMRRFLVALFCASCLFSSAAPAFAEGYSKRENGAGRESGSRPENGGGRDQGPSGDKGGTTSGRGEGTNGGRDQGKSGGDTRSTGTGGDSGTKSGGGDHGTNTGASDRRTNNGGIGDAAGTNDQQRARNAVAAGDFLPLKDVLNLIDQDRYGIVIAMDIRQYQGNDIYRLKTRDRSGVIHDFGIDPRTGSFLNIRGF